MIGVIGAGAWGTALAQMLASDGRPVLLWALEPELVEEINARRSNSLFLPSASLAPSIRATGELAEAAACEILLLVTPAQHLAATLARMPSLPRDLVLCSKGIEAQSGRMMHEVASAAAGERHRGRQAGGGEAQWQRLAPAIARPTFRPYYSDDLVGAEVGGAVKNVLAIACGVVEGLNLGQNARAALIARGYAEMQRFGEALGAERSTIAGLCGRGDLVLTCSSSASRNFSLGKALGQGQDPKALMNDRHTVAEGAHTAPVLVELAGRHGVAMPIAEAVARLLEGTPAHAVASELLARPLTAEGPIA